MKRSWLVGACMLTLVGLVPAPAAAWTKITSDQPQYGLITGYYYDEDAGDCTRNVDDVCVGSSEYVLNIGDVAVHYVGTNHQDPVAPFGSRVQIPTPITLFWENGYYDDLQWFWVNDTGGGSSGSGNGWVDIYCGDGWQNSPYRNPYYTNNYQQVIGTYGDGIARRIWFDV